MATPDQITQITQQITTNITQQFQQHIRQQEQQIQDLTTRLQATEQKSQQPQNIIAHTKITPSKPDTFNGSRSITPADVWLGSVEQYFRACEYANNAPLTDEFKINFTAAQLRGSAATWWRREQPTITTTLNITWKTFKDPFIKHFLPVATKDSARAALHSMRQRSNINGYIDEFNRHLIMLDTTDMSEADQLYCFKKGLRPDLAHDIFLLNPKTLPEAQAAAIRSAIESPQRKYNWNAYQKPQYHAQHAQGAGGNSTPMELGRVQTETEETTDETEHDAQEEEEQTLNAMKYTRLTPEQVEEYKRTGKCFRCAKFGHLSRNCPNKIKPQVQQRKNP